MKKLSKNQINILLLFAQNYSLRSIARKQRVTLRAIRRSVSRIADNHSVEFENACSLRRANRKNKNKLKFIENFNDFNETLFPIQKKF